MNTKKLLIGTERTITNTTFEYNIPMSSLVQGKIAPVQNNLTNLVYDATNQQWVNTAVAVKQSPVYFMGGMFGEYVYANNQLITASFVQANYNNFNTTSNFSQLNATCRFSWNYYYR